MTQTPDPSDPGQTRDDSGPTRDQEMMELTQSRWAGLEG